MQNDPRLMQAMGALNGYRVTATEADIRAAERVGDIKKRDAIQTADVEEALKCATADEAKQAGNEHFKAAAYSKALACYARARSLLHRELAAAAVDEGEGDYCDDVKTDISTTESHRIKTLMAVLLSNSAAALLKLSRYDEALCMGRDACAIAPPDSEPLSKIYYRIAHAHEGLKQYDDALSAMERSRVEAIALAERTDSSQAESDGAGSGSEGSGGGSGSEATGGAMLSARARAVARPMLQERRRIMRLKEVAVQDGRAKAAQVCRRLQRRAPRRCAQATLRDLRVIETWCPPKLGER